MDDNREPNSMMEVHVMNRNGAVLRAFALGDTREVIVGRDESCDIQIKSPSVSREHCAIEQDDSGMFVRDLGSTAGMVVNGEKVAKVEVKDGLEVVVGPAVLKFFEAAM
ncbi:MAG TPA: FHA domain-containing protein [Phycisphaerales bacterium]|nr:FHA domain-containing protein [Phycisphaerales bacterium]